jgi:hypothetical protein
MGDNPLDADVVIPAHQLPLALYEARQEVIRLTAENARQRGLLKSALEVMERDNHGSDPHRQRRRTLDRLRAALSAEAGDTEAEPAGVYDVMRLQAATEQATANIYRSAEAGDTDGDWQTGWTHG